MTLDRQGRLVIGGMFEKAGLTIVNNVSRWNGQNWEAFGSGLKDGVIYALNADTNGKLIVAGGFYQAGGKVSRNLAVWKEPNYLWFPLISR
jgi:ligand-binding sensor domain-containing protein